MVTLTTEAGALVILVEASKRKPMVYSAFAVVLGSMLLAPLASAASNSKTDEQQLLHESEYRSELEEVVIVGRQPEWRQQQQDEQWRPGRFKLPEQSSKARMQWLPEYTKEDRDNYNSVRDRTGENPEIKVFNWKF